MGQVLTLPIESRPLLVLSPPVGLWRDREHTEPRVDRETGTPLVEVAVALTEGGMPQVLRVQVPASGVPKELTAGQSVRASGLVFRSGESNGRPWSFLRATAIVGVKP